MAKLNSETLDKLRILLSSWVVFYQKAHTYHWDLKGNTFLEFHKHLETLYNESVEHTDKIAERLKQLGETISLDLATASLESVVYDSNRAESTKDITQDLIEGISKLNALQTEIYEEANEQSDFVTVDLITGLSKWCDFNGWFLTSTIE